MPVNSSIRKNKVFRSATLPELLDQDLNKTSKIRIADSQAVWRFHPQSFVDEQQRHVIPLSKALVMGIDVQVLYAVSEFDRG
jgi:hypothetical protein